MRSFENFRYFLQTKDSNKDKSISIAERQEIFGMITAKLERIHAILILSI